MADAAAGLDLSQILGAGSSLAGMGLGAYSQGQQNSILQNALNTIGPTQLQGYNLTGPGGMSSGYNPNGGASISLGNLGGLFNNLAGSGTADSSNYNPALLANLTNTSNGTLGNALAGLNSAYGGNAAYQNAAALQAGTLNNTYNQTYNNTLGSLQAIQAPQVQQQAYGLQNTLFGNGTLNSSGAASGATAAANFGRDVNAMNAQNSLTAQQQALNAMTGQAGIASSLSNTGNSLLSNAFSNFGNTNQLISGLNTASLNNSINAVQGAGALNTLGLNNYNSALQTGSAQANAKNLSLFPYAGVATALAGSPTISGMLAGGLSSMGSSMMGSNGLNGLAGLLNNSSLGNWVSGLFGGGGLSTGGTFGTDAISGGSLADSALSDAGFGFNGAGGQAATSAASPATSGISGAGGLFGAAGDATGIYSGIKQGGVQGYGKSALDTYKLANSLGLFGSGLGAYGSGAAANAAVTGALGTVGSQTAGTSAAIAASNSAALGGAGSGAAGASSAAGGSGAASSGLSGLGYAALPIAAFAGMYLGGNALNSYFDGPNNNWSIGQINNLLGQVGSGGSGLNAGSALNPNGGINQNNARALTALSQLQDGSFGNANSYVAQQLNNMGYQTLNQQVAANGGFIPTPNGGGGTGELNDYMQQF